MGEPKGLASIPGALRWILAPGMRARPEFENPLLHANSTQLLWRPIEGRFACCRVGGMPLKIFKARIGQWVVSVCAGGVGSLGFPLKPRVSATLGRPQSKVAISISPLLLIFKSHTPLTLTPLTRTPSSSHFSPSHDPRSRLTLTSHTPATLTLTLFTVIQLTRALLTVHVVLQVLLVSVVVEKGYARAWSQWVPQAQVAAGRKVVGVWWPRVPTACCHWACNEYVQPLDVATTGVWKGNCACNWNTLRL